MANVQILAASHRKRQLSSYHLRRERGQDAINFIHFLTPIAFVIDGVEMHMAKNVCIIYTPGVRQEYMASHGGFENNFVTFKPDDANFLSRFKLPLNEPFYIKDDDVVTRCVEYITWAATNKLESLDAQITERVNTLFRLLEQGQLPPGTKEQRNAQTKQRFIILRGEVYLNPVGWTVKKMAAKVWLTRSRFSVLYRELFATTPLADLTAATLLHAKERLANTQDTIQSIAIDCGYKNAESFIRMFKEKEGIAPGQYRKKGRESEKI